MHICQQYCAAHCGPTNCSPMYMTHQTVTVSHTSCRNYPSFNMQELLRFGRGMGAPGDVFQRAAVNFFRAASQPLPIITLHCVCVCVCVCVFVSGLLVLRLAVHTQARQPWVCQQGRHLHGRIKFNHVRYGVKSLFCFSV